MLTDEQVLLQKISDGDNQAFASLFRCYYRDLVLFAGSWLSGQQEACEDIVQEVFINLWENRKEIGKISFLRPFLLKSVQNRCVGHLRHEQVKNRYAELKSLFPTGIHCETEDYIFYSELNERLQEALAHLSPVQRQCFELNRMAGMKQAQIAEELGIPLRTVELRISEAIKILKIRLKNYFVLVSLFLLL